MVMKSIPDLVLFVPSGVLIFNLSLPVRQAVCGLLAATRAGCEWGV